MYGRRHLQFMKVSNQEVEIRVHYSQQELNYPSTNAGESWWRRRVRKDRVSHAWISDISSDPGWNVLSLLSFGFLHCAYVVQVWLCNYLKADPHITTPDSLLRKQLTKYLRVSGPGIRSCQTDKVLPLLCRDCLLSVLKAQDSGGLSLRSMILLKAYKFFSLFFIFSIICTVTSGTYLAEAMRKALSDPKLYFHDSHVSKHLASCLYFKAIQIRDHYILMALPYSKIKWNKDKNMKGRRKTNKQFWWEIKHCS